MLIIPIADIRKEHCSQVGGKGFALAHLKAGGMQVPKAVCLTTEAYRTFVGETGLDKKIRLEIHRKRLEKARWEEMWDTSLRIRNLFLRAAYPRKLSLMLREGLDDHFRRIPVVVRSSAPGEDSAAVSFAGIHESYINVIGAEAILKHVKLVWASLWSDAAILYRKELELDLEKSVMAVVVQEFVGGESSGVFFSKNPMDGNQSVIEAVYGLNQGLVDGTIEPDRWILKRKNGMILNHMPASHTRSMRPSSNGVEMVDLDPREYEAPPLTPRKVQAVFEMGEKAENSFGCPQDVEWTFRKRTLFTLQSRPITTEDEDRPKDQKSWYLSLRRSFENLRVLRSRIETHTIPDMIREAGALAEQELSGQSDRKLSDEMQRRKKIYVHWVDVYWKEFIPFAHGFRLFGQVYNDKIQPDDPYEFVELLRPRSMHGLERNRILGEMAAFIREDAALAWEIKNGRSEDVKHHEFKILWDTFWEEYANLKVFEETDSGVVERFSGLLLRMAESSPSRLTKKQAPEGNTIEPELFFSQFKREDQDYARDLLDLARFSYRLRDDDNIYLGKIERQMNRSVFEGRRRLKRRFPSSYMKLSDEQIIKCLRDPAYKPPLREKKNPRLLKSSWQVRQLRGQPAGKGLVTGVARVIHEESDLFEFKKGEVLICESVEPNMTFVVPLAGAIVEKRGGMLIHGAIIAREYGIPCVTGIAEADRIIRTGDSVTVDGFLGLVIVAPGKK